MANKKNAQVNEWSKGIIKLLPIIICGILFAACNQGLGKKSHHTTESISDKSVVLKRPGFTLEYPNDWHIDSSSKLYDIDGHFTLNSPVESGLITFFVFNIEKNEKETLEKHIHAQLENSMKDGVVSYFTTWGNYQGHGASIKGKMEGAWKAEIKIFVYGSKEKSFLITSVCADGYRDEVIPGLEFIESAFKLNQPPPVQVPINHT